MELELKDYFSVLRHRKNYFLKVALTILDLGIIYALRFSNYRSFATVEIAQPEVSASTAIPSGMNAGDYSESLADLRISHLQQKVLSTSTLIEVITKFNLYEGARNSVPIADIANGMRKKIKIDLVSSALANPSTAPRDALSAIAFTLSFDYNDPLVTQQVTNELVSRFLDEDIKDRRKSAEETTLFLDGQIKALEASMAEQEKKIADFRSNNEGADPEFMVFNQQAAQNMMVSIQNIDTQIAANVVTQGTLRGQLATVDPYSRVIADGQLLTTPTIQLKALKTQLTTISSQYGAKHPDVIKLSNQIKALESQVGKVAPESGNLIAQIEEAKTNLEVAQKNYGSDHPDVKALEKKIVKLEKKLEESETNDATNVVPDADNPTYLQISSQLKSSEAQYNALMEQKESLLDEQKKYHKAITKNPAVVQKMAELTRDYENSQLRYRALKEKKMSADMSATIEQDRSGQRLVLLNPPELPLRTNPSRSIIVLGGLVLAIIAGLLSVAIAQVISQSIVGSSHLASIVGVAPLVVIPHIKTASERKSIKEKFLNWRKVYG